MLIYELLKRLEFIKASEHCLSQRDSAVKYKISQDAVFTILKSKQEYLGDFESNQCNAIKRKFENDPGKKSMIKHMDDLLLKGQKKFPISRPFLQEKARQASAKLDDRITFKAFKG